MFQVIQLVHGGTDGVLELWLEHETGYPFGKVRDAREVHEEGLGSVQREFGLLRQVRANRGQLFFCRSLAIKEYIYE